MPSSACADPTFGLNPQSIAVLHLMTGLYLPTEEPPRTFPWYNGLENGIAFVVRRGKKWRVIVVGEDVRSDNLFVEFWDQPERPFNAPTIEQREAVAGLTLERTPFESGSIASVAELATNLMRECLGAA